jgi:hypothetical protein
MPLDYFIRSRGSLPRRRYRRTLTGLTAAALCAFIWWWCRPALLNYESYLYAGGIEGFIDISALYNVFLPEIRMPDFGRFHPNHPLPHLLAYWLFSVCNRAGVEFSALDILIAVNYIASAVAVFVIFRIAVTLTADLLISFFFALLAGFSPVFWFSAVSAETYEVAYCLMAIAFLQMLRPYGSERIMTTIRKALLFSLAFSFHFGVALFAIPVALWYALAAARQRSIRPILSLALFGVVSCFVFITVYMILFMQTFGITDLGEWWQIFSMQSRIPMGGQYAPDHGGIWHAAETLFASLANGMLAGNGTFQRIARIHLLIAMLVGAIYVLRLGTRHAFATAQAAWIIVPVGFLLLVMRSPTNITYSLMLMLPAFLSVLLLVKRTATATVARSIVMGWSLLTAGSTWGAIILPKAGLPEETVYFAARISVNDMRHTPMLALVHNYYGIYPDLYYLGNRHKVRAEKVFFHYDESFPGRLLAEIRKHKKVQLLTDRLLAREEAWLRSEGVRIEQVFYHAELHAPELYWLSIRPRFSVDAGYKRELSLYRLYVD